MERLLQDKEGQGRKMIGWTKCPEPFGSLAYVYGSRPNKECLFVFTHRKPWTYDALLRRLIEG